MLRAAVFDVTAIAEISPRAEDRTVIEMALREDRILLTEDKDFGRLVYAERVQSAGVILIRVPAHLRTDLPARVLQLVRERSDRLTHSFTVIGPRLVRIRRPPSGGSDVVDETIFAPRREWAHIQRTIAECHECLTRWSSAVAQPLRPGEIPDPPARVDILFVGVAPTRIAGASRGGHFYSDNGDRLRQGLFGVLEREFGVPLRNLGLLDGNNAFHGANCFFVHAAKVRPVDADAPPKDAIAFCARRHLADEIATLRPRAICFLGKNNLDRATSELFGAPLGGQSQQLALRERRWDGRVALTHQPRRGWASRTAATVHSLRVG